MLPVLWELDGDATGPLSFAGQQLPSGDWSMTTRVTIDNTIEWQSAGLYLWQSDNNFIKFGVTFHGASQRHFELTSDNPPDGTREFSTNESAAGYGDDGVAAPVPPGQHDPRPVRQGRERPAGRVGHALRLAARSTRPRRVRAPACWSARTRAASRTRRGT